MQIYFSVSSADNQGPKLASSSVAEGKFWTESLSG